MPTGDVSDSKVYTCVTSLQLAALDLANQPDEDVIRVMREQEKGGAEVSLEARMLRYALLRVFAESLAETLDYMPDTTAQILASAHYPHIAAHTFITRCSSYIEMMRLHIMIRIVCIHHRTPQS